MNLPSSRHTTISVVTVVRNGKPFLERTIKSVLDQTYDEVEFIIIDGGSSDGTLDIIRRYDTRIDHWLSEPDHGIYDAMNKGTERATGEWLIFLNAGDEFADTQVLSRLMQELPEHADVLYGRHEEVFGDGYSRTPVLGDLRDLWKGMVFCHQSMLVRTSIMKDLRFNILQRIAADYEFIWAVYAQKYRFVSVDQVISRVIADGFSAKNNLELIRAQWKIAKRCSGRGLGLDGYYLCSLASVAFKNAVKRLLPGGIVNRLRSRPWK